MNQFDSPYNAMGNNPVVNIDPDGMKVPWGAILSALGSAVIKAGTTTTIKMVEHSFTYGIRMFAEKTTTTTTSPFAKGLNGVLQLASSLLALREGSKILSDGLLQSGRDALLSLGNNIQTVLSKIKLFRYVETEEYLAPRRALDRIIPGVDASYISGRDPVTPIVFSWENVNSVFIGFHPAAITDGLDIYIDGVRVFNNPAMVNDYESFYNLQGGNLRVVATPNALGTGAFRLRITETGVHSLKVRKVKFLGLIRVGGKSKTLSNASLLPGEKTRRRGWATSKQSAYTHMMNNHF